MRRALAFAALVPLALASQAPGTLTPDGPATIFDDWHGAHTLEGLHADLLTAFRVTVQPGGRAGTVRFLPYLSGERTPHNDAVIRGAFTGLGSGTTRDDLTRAVLEGVAFGLRDSHQALKETGARLDRMMAIGGGARSRYWLRVIATALDVTLTLPADGEFGAALGAARLGMAAAGAGRVNDIMTAPDVVEEIAPDAALRDRFDAAYQAFRAAYPAIRGVQ